MNKLRLVINDAIMRCKSEKRNAATEIARLQEHIAAFDDQQTTLEMLLDKLDSEEKEVSENEQTEKVDC